MKRFFKLSKILFALVIILVSIMKFNYSYATNEIASGSCGDNITWSLDSNGVLTITGSGKMSGTGCAWADYKDKVKEVKFEGSITSISDGAFEYNTNLQTITLPNSLEGINRRAFAECTNLKNVTFSNNLISIGTSAFYKCTALEEVDLPESLIYIRDYAFEECTSLKSITIRSMIILIGDNELTISDTAKINAYKFSDAFYYARFYGRTFTDLNTNETTTATITNQSYLDVLPTTNIKALGVTSHGGRSYSGNELRGYSADFCNEKDTTNTDYQNIKAKVEELTADCTTQRDKAYAIFRWAFINIDYQYAYGASADIDRIYRIFNEEKGNCEAYTMMTNYMLYLCGIPTATASNLTHEWTVAFVDGQWIYIDSTQGYFGTLPPNKVNIISFAYDGMVYAIDDPIDGAKITGIAKTSEEIDKLTTFTIPTNSYTKSIYPASFDRDLELKAEVGTVGAEFIKNNRLYCITNNNQIIGRNDKYPEIEKPIDVKPYIDSTGIIFDAKFYLEKYPDLKKAYGTDETKAYNHFVTKGINEGRQGSRCFDVKYYLEQNPDVQKAYGDNYSKALRHFALNGLSEGRVASKEFNVKIYQSNYVDLQRSYGNVYKKYYIHFVTKGYKENRNATEIVAKQLTDIDKCVFNAEYYLAKYPDIKKAYGTDATKAYNHFVTKGIKEGRQGSIYFNVKYYLAKYPDLQKAYGNDYVKAYNHFITKGLKEGRIGSAEFNVKTYQANYADLQKAYGNEYLKYYIHYMTKGIKENRKAV